MSEPEPAGSQKNKNAFETYKLYAQFSESLAERRRAYFSIFLTLSSALVVGPYVSVKDNQTAMMPLLVVASSVGLIVCHFWASFSKNSRGMIIYRGRWLAMMEHFLREKGELPNYAKVFTYEYNQIFNVQSGRFFGQSVLEMRGAKTFFWVFLLNPLVALGLLKIVGPFAPLRVALIGFAINAAIAVPLFLRLEARDRERDKKIISKNAGPTIRLMLRNSTMRLHLRNLVVQAPLTFFTRDFIALTSKWTLSTKFRWPNFDSTKEMKWARDLAVNADEKAAQYELWQQYLKDD